mmetsp:Transcript_1065/g.1579  ORF Transcript_1065/g.1579 Transcript_1065/m.1579 type:complete len:99 (+) Transcript_1065:142-438(+)
MRAWQELLAAAAAVRETAWAAIVRAPKNAALVPVEHRQESRFAGVGGGGDGPNPPQHDPQTCPEKPQATVNFVRWRDGCGSAASHDHPSNRCPVVKRE